MGLQVCIARSLQGTGTAHIGSSCKQYLLAYMRTFVASTRLLKHSLGLYVHYGLSPLSALSRPLNASALSKNLPSTLTALIPSFISAPSQY